MKVLLNFLPEPNHHDHFYIALLRWTPGTPGTLSTNRPDVEPLDDEGRSLWTFLPMRDPVLIQWARFPLQEKGGSLRADQEELSAIKVNDSEAHRGGGVLVLMGL